MTVQVSVVGLYLLPQLVSEEDAPFPPQVSISVPVHTAVWTGSEMIVWGGVSSEQSLANTGGRYDPVSDTWTGATSTVNAPTALARATMSATGTPTPVTFE